MTIASTEMAPAAMTARAQDCIVPPDETMSSTSRAGRPFKTFGSSRAISTERSPRRVFLATVHATPSNALSSLTHGARLGIRTDNDRSRIEASPARRCLAMAGMADRLSASMPGQTSLRRAVRWRWASTVITRSKLLAISLPDDLLADRLAGMKCSVLPHVAEVGRDKNEPRAAISPKRFRREQQGQELVVRTVERAHRQC